MRVGRILSCTCASTYPVCLKTITSCTTTTETYTLSLHDALPISDQGQGERERHGAVRAREAHSAPPALGRRSEEHTSELQSRPHLVCRLLPEKKKNLRVVIRRLIAAAYVLPADRVVLHSLHFREF